MGFSETLISFLCNLPPSPSEGGVVELIRINWAAEKELSCSLPSAHTHTHTDMCTEENLRLLIKSQNSTQQIESHLRNIKFKIQILHSQFSEPIYRFKVTGYPGMTPPYVIPQFLECLGYYLCSFKMAQCSPDIWKMDRLIVILDMSCHLKGLTGQTVAYLNNILPFRCISVPFIGPGD